MRSMVRDQVARSGQVLREWQIGKDETRLIVHDGDHIVEYRVWSTPGAAHYELLYAINTAVGQCYEGFGRTPLACERVAQIAEMRQYVEQSLRPAGAAAALP